MSQLSLPFRVLLLAAAVFAGVWTLFLRPKDEPAPAGQPAAQQQKQPSAPGVLGLKGATNSAASAGKKATDAALARERAAEAVDGQAVPSDQGGTAVAPDAQAATTVPEGGTAAKSGTAIKPGSAESGKPAARPDADSLAAYIAGAGPAKSLVRWLADGRVVMMVFSNRSSDSAATVRAARSLARRGSAVIRLRVTNIGNVGKYAVFTEKTPIGQAPTTLIIGPSKRARVIVGYTTVAEMRQAVHDVAPKLHLRAKAAHHRRHRKAAHHG